MRVIVLGPKNRRPDIRTQLNSKASFPLSRVAWGQYAVLSISIACTALLPDTPLVVLTMAPHYPLTDRKMLVTATCMRHHFFLLHYYDHACNACRV